MQISSGLHGGYMALLINDNHIQCFHKDTARSLMLVHLYFTSPDYGAMLLYIDLIDETGPFNYHYTKFFTAMIRYGQEVPCYHIAAVFDLFNHFVVSKYPVV